MLVKGAKGYNPGTCHGVKSVQLIWRLGTRRFHLRVPDLQMSCSDLNLRQGTRIVVPVVAARAICPIQHRYTTQLNSKSQENIKGFLPDYVWHFPEISSLILMVLMSTVTECQIILYITLINCGNARADIFLWLSFTKQVMDEWGMSL